MRILHFTRHDFSGAPARGALALHRELLRLGHASEVFVAAQQTDSLGLSLLFEKAVADDVIFERVQKCEFDENAAGDLASFFTLGYPGFSLTHHPAVEQAEIIHLHDVKDLLSPQTIGSLVRSGKKVVWSVTDAWAFTGGCHAPMQCEKFTCDCRECPQLSEDKAGLPAGILLDKLANFPAGALSLVTPEPWLATSLPTSAIFRDQPVRLIGPALDRKILRPMEKSLARQRLGISEKSFVLVVWAENLGAGARGRQAIQEFIDVCPQFNALQRLAKAGELVVFALGLEGEIPHPTIPVNCQIPADHEDLSQILSAADLAVLPHVEENSASVVLESFHFGVPVVAFQTMGMEENIVEGQTGMLIPNFETRRMAEAVSLLAIRPAKIAEWSQQCRQVADTRWDIDRQARAYLEVYAQAVAPEAVAPDSGLFISPAFFGFFWNYANSTKNEPSEALRETLVAADTATEQMSLVLERSAAKINLMERRLARFKQTSGEVKSEDFTKALTSLRKLQGTLAKTLRRREALLRQEVAKGNGMLPLRKHFLPEPDSPPQQPQMPLPAFVEKKLIDFVTTRLNKEYGKGIGTLDHYPPRPLRPEKFPKPKLLRRDLPTIAIVTPSYMQGHFIGKTISSITDQKYPKLRYAVQDAGSTDDTLQILEKRASDLTVWSSVPDTGQARAIREGFEKISGNIMAWLNSDDLLLPGSIRFVAEYFRAHPEVDVVYGHRVLINENDEEVCRWVLPPHDPHLLDRVDYIPQETLFWRRELWNKVGGIDPKFRFAMDWDLLLRFSKAGARIVRVPYFLGCFRVHSEQKTSAAMNTIGAEEIAHLRQRTLGRLPEPTELGGLHRAVRKRSALYEFLLNLGIRL